MGGGYRIFENATAKNPEGIRIRLSGRAREKPVWCGGRDFAWYFGRGGDGSASGNPLLGFGLLSRTPRIQVMGGG